MRRALWLGLPEVVDALEQNPHLLAGLLTGARRSHLMDEPGLLLGATFLATWSRLRQTPFLARILVSVQRRQPDLLAEADRVARNAAQIVPAAAASLDMSLGIYRGWMEQLETALAVAWRRYRDTPPALPVN